MTNTTKESARTFSVSDTNKVKGFAIIAMIIHHCFLDAERYAGQIVDFTPLTEHLVNNIALSMKICVAIFTFLSAYGMTLTYKKKADEDGLLTRRTVSKAVYRRVIKLLSSFIFIFLTAQLYSLLIVHDDRYAYVYGTGIKSVFLFISDMLGLAELFETPTFLATFWYISLAIIVIFVLPVFYEIYRRFGTSTVLFLGAFLRVAFPLSENHSYAYFPVYAFTVVLGMVCADKDIITKIADIKGLPSVLKFLIYVLFICAAIYTRQLIRKTMLLPLWEGIISLAICTLFYEFVNHWIGIREVLSVLGRHSGNIFLIHNFIRVLWYYDFTYSFRNWLLISMVLLVTSLLVSFFIETIKKCSGYNKLTERLLSVSDEKGEGVIEK